MMFIDNRGENSSATSKWKVSEMIDKMVENCVSGQTYSIVGTCGDDEKN